MVKASAQDIVAAKALRQHLLQIFPRFAEACTAQEMEECESDGMLTPHFVMGLFRQYFGEEQQNASSERQLEALGTFINHAVAESGQLENAVSTCFLEHLRRKSYKPLSPYLSAGAKKKIHA